ncbi:putative oxidoreductase [Microlunatus phosphovorus NM-1]|uniref:Putative oxidoreductase n=1 Tax=Microlunatus phosphovorus (strain ATCC 700054 / DSM 10555 / JCM 9379 / NBRC 101784 / NCIMB 13414 / VKM Ac-1990 / NM-1) TaxID=1032480 RepID=F5XEI2_MICPN|nr:Gfo/Idh/MocA family oxidoreductase [Microlunatus phosphovorus]BAK35198.1 putative oxidoreductase [Microlunatus phosphovorus NM-1]
MTSDPTPHHDGVIRTAVVGFGTSGRVFHSPFLASSPEYSLDVIVTGNADRAAEAARLHPGAAVVSTIDELLARASELDLVVIGSPPASHAELATAAIDAGTDVVVDKPFTVTGAEGRALVAHAAQAGRRLTVFQNRRWDGDYLTVRRLVDEGVLGTIGRFESRFEWWKPTPRQSWKIEASVATGGGILYDLGTHVIDQALGLFGPVADVYAELAVRRPGGVAEDDAFLALQHASGTISHLWMSSLTPQFGPRFRVLGAAGGYTVWGLDGQEAALAAGVSPSSPDFGVAEPSRWGVAGAEPTLTAVPTERGDYGAFYRQLADAIRRGGPVPVDPADAIAVLELIERVHAGAARR